MGFRDILAGAGSIQGYRNEDYSQGLNAGAVENANSQKARLLQQMQAEDVYWQNVNARNQGAQLPGPVPMGTEQVYENTPYSAPPVSPTAPASVGLAAPARGLTPPLAAPIDYGPAIANYQRMIAAGGTAGPQPTQIESDRRALAGAFIQPNAAGIDVLAAPGRALGMLGEQGLNLIGRGVNAVTGKPTMPTDFNRFSKAGFTPIYDQYGRQYENPPEDPRIADYRAAVTKLQAMQAAQGKAPAVAAVPAALGQGTTVAGSAFVPTGAPAQGQPTQAPTAPVTGATQPEGQSFAAGAGELANGPQLKMIDMQLQQAQGMMDAATETGNPQLFQRAQAQGMQLMQQRNVLIGRQAIVDMALGGKKANAALHTINQTFGTDFRVKSAAGASGSRLLSVFHGNDPIPGMQGIPLQQFQSVMLAKVDPEYAKQVVATQTAASEQQAKYGDPNRIAAAKLANDRYIAEIGESGKRLAEQAKAQGFEIKPNPAGGWMMANSAGVAFEIVPETPATKNTPAAPARMVRIPMPAMNTGVPGQGAAVYKNGAWVTPQ